MENLYCTIFIVDVSQNPEEVDTISSRIQQLIEDHGGIIKRTNPWGKQKLAYPIQNKSYGFYVEIEFTANSHLNIPKTIEQEYRINDRVLRYLTYVVTKKELQQRQINAGKMKEDAQKESQEKRSTEREKAEEAPKSKTESPPAEEDVETEKTENVEASPEKEQETEGQESQEPKPSEDVEKETPQEVTPEDKKEQ